MHDTARNRSIPVILSLVSSPVVEREPTLDDHVRRAYEGDRDAADVVARELRPDLLHEVRFLLGDFEHHADDVVDDVLVAMLDGRIRPRKGPDEGVGTLMRAARLFARRYLREVRLSYGGNDLVD
jgi:hypothetical protein